MAHLKVSCGAVKFRKSQKPARFFFSFSNTNPENTRFRFNDGSRVRSLQPFHKKTFVYYTIKVKLHLQTAPENYNLMSIIKIIGNIEKLLTTSGVDFSLI